VATYGFSLRRWLPLSYKGSKDHEEAISTEKTLAMNGHIFSQRQLNGTPCNMERAKCEEQLAINRGTNPARLMRRPSIPYPVFA
jgi:hypothetical protein